MPYKEKFSEICDLKDSIGKFATDYSSASKRLLNRISAYVNLSAFSGNSAASSKNYFSEFHIPIIKYLNILIEEYYNRMLFYKDDYNKIDSKSDALISEESLEMCEQQLKKSISEFNNVNLDIKRVLSEISGLVSVSQPPVSKMLSYTEEDIHNIIVLNSQISDCENMHAEDIKKIQTFYEQIKNMISSQLGADRVMPKEYTQGYFKNEISKVGINATLITIGNFFSQRRTVILKAEEDYGYLVKFVEDCDDSSPEIRRKFEQYLNDTGMSDEEINRIKFMVYTAPEPYKTIYLEHLDTYKIGKYNTGDGSAYYNPLLNMIYLDGKDATIDCEKGTNNTFFHESGHAIDDFEKTDIVVVTKDMTSSYEYNGQSLNEIIKSDVRENVRRHVLQYTSDPEHIDEVMTALNLDDDSSFKYKGGSSTDPSVEKIINAVKKDMRSDLYGTENEAASDVYGGVTNNAVVGDWGHWPDNGQSTTNYWYRNGKATGNQESELWAEFFAAQMTDDEVKLASIKEHFPQAYEAMEAMARDMAKK